MSATLLLGCAAIVSGALRDGYSLLSIMPVVSGLTPTSRRQRERGELLDGRGLALTGGREAPICPAAVASMMRQTATTCTRQREVRHWAKARNHGSNLLAIAHKSRRPNRRPRRSRWMSARFLDQNYTACEPSSGRCAPTRRQGRAPSKNSDHCAYSVHNRPRRTTQ